MKVFLWIVITKTKRDNHYLLVHVFTTVRLRDKQKIDYSPPLKILTILLKFLFPLLIIYYFEAAGGFDMLYFTLQKVWFYDYFKSWHYLISYQIVYLYIFLKINRIFPCFDATECFFYLYYPWLVRRNFYPLRFWSLQFFVPIKWSAANLKL